MSGHDPASGHGPSRAAALDAVRGLGSHILAAVDVDAIAAQLRQLPTGALLAELEAVVAAADSVDPARNRRRAGWWGRLLGRDLVAQAQPDPVANRIRLRLSAAQALADAVAAQIAALTPSTAHLEQHVAQLEALLAREAAASTDATPAHAAARQRRLSHLDAIAASWRATLAQIALVRAHATQLLDRHAQLRDLLATLWRERETAHAVTARVAPERLARLHADLHGLHATIPSLSPPVADSDHPTQEPSP